MRLLVTKPTYDTYGDAIRALAPDVDLVLWDDGVFRRLDGSPRLDGADGFELAWATHDLFVGTGYRAYFEALDKAANLRWFQSPGAGTDSPFFTGLLERGVRLSTSHVTSIPIAEFVIRSVLDVFQQSDRWVQVRGGADLGPPCPAGGVRHDVADRRGRGHRLRGRDPGPGVRRDRDRVEAPSHG